MWVSGSGVLCLSLPVPQMQPESPEFCWLLHSPVGLLATSHRAERPFPGVGKGSVGAK